ASRRNWRSIEPQRVGACVTRDPFHQRSRAPSVSWSVSPSSKIRALRVSATSAAALVGCGGRLRPKAPARENSSAPAPLPARQRPRVVADQLGAGELAIARLPIRHHESESPSGLTPEVPLPLEPLPRSERRFRVARDRISRRRTQERLLERPQCLTGAVKLSA